MPRLQTRIIPKRSRPLLALTAIAATLLSTGAARADENLFGYLTGAETLPKGASELYVWWTQRSGKDVGHYTANDVEVEYEYGFTPKLMASFAVLGQGIDSRDIVVDEYIPGDEKYGLRFAGVEGKVKYRFRSPLLDPYGLAMRVWLEQEVLDPYSGRDKDATSLGLDLLLQKNFLGDRLVAVANVGVESEYSKRRAIEGLPEEIEWETEPETELELFGGLGFSYRFASNWFVGAETFYETEFESEEGQERWSWFAGPTLHYGGRKWWATATWAEQLRGGGEEIPGQTEHLHLVEKTERELRLKVGWNF